MNHFTVQFRLVYGYGGSPDGGDVTSWGIWPELGKHDTLEKAIAAVENAMRSRRSRSKYKIHSISNEKYDEDGLYQGPPSGSYGQIFQYRFPIVVVEESPWKIGFTTVAEKYTEI